MSLRISSVALALLAVACREPAADTNLLAPAQASSPAATMAEDRVPCAIAGKADFARVCTLDRSEDPAGVVLTVHHPDGGFRRLRVTDDGRGVETADGAQPAAVTIVGTEIEVAIGTDRYRLPATIRAK